MALSYMGYAMLDGYQFLATSVSMPENVNRIDSSSGWGGDGTGATHGIKIPRAYDWSSNEGSIGYDISQGFGSILRGWVTQRMNSKSLFFVPTEGGQQTFNELYWTSISVGASEGGLVAGDISVMSVFRDAETVGSQYIGNRVGNRGCAAFGTIPSLNAGNANLCPVPFWKSTVVGGATGGNEVMSWSLTCTQEISKIFACEAAHSAQPPKILGFGPMIVELQMEVFIPSGGSFTFVPETSCVVNLGEGTLFALGQMELQSHAQDLKGQSDISTATVTYQVFQL